MCDVTIKTEEITELYFFYNELECNIKGGSIVSDLYHRTLNQPDEEEIVISKAEFHDLKYVESVITKRILRW